MERDPLSHHEFTHRDPPNLSPEQSHALAAILANPGISLLHGVITGV
jgi:hypothetical protein